MNKLIQDEEEFFAGRERCRAKHFFGCPDTPFSRQDSRQFIPGYHCPEFTIERGQLVEVKA